ncbi:hypothetical protein SLE2022_311230 [Rubroshorea leprosula]
MPTHPGSPGPEDPLQEYFGLSLFPRTFASLPNPPRPTHSDDLQFTHSFLKSMSIPSPNRFLEEAKDIVDSSSKLMNSEMPSNGTTTNEAFDSDITEQPRERRPGLGRNKRARFSLKPISSQPTVNLGPKLDLKKLRDPEEFFSAYEKQQNAKRELQKQTGAVLTDWDLNNLSMDERPRRQGTLGRRSAKYTHRTYNGVSSQENCEEEIVIPLLPSSQKENLIQNAESEERELAGSVTEAAEMVNQLLDDLLAKNQEELDGDGAVTLLQERLQIKPIDFRKLSLPDLQDIRKIDLKASGENLAKPRNSLLGLSSKTPYCQAESSVYNVATCPPSKNSMASISFLRKQILQSDPLSDPFSLDVIDRSQASNASPTQKVNKQSDQVEMEKVLNMSDQLESAMSEATDIGTASLELDMRDFTGPPDNLVNEPNDLGFIVNLGLSGSNAGNEDNMGVSNDATKQSNQVGTGKEVLSISNQLESAMLEENATEDATASFELDRGDVTGPSDNLVSDKPNAFGSVINLGLNRSNVGNEDPVGVSNYGSKQSDQFGTGKIVNMSYQLESVIVEQNLTAVASANSELDKEDFSGPSDNFVNCNDFGLNGSQADKEDNLESNQMDHMVSVPTDLQFVICIKSWYLMSCREECDKVHVEDVLQEVADASQSELNVEDSTVDKSDSNQRMSDDTSCAGVMDHAMVGASKVAESGPELNKETIPTSSTVPVNKQRGHPRKQQKNKEYSRRKSLADFGTFVNEKGVRRSTRVKSRPLEYWKGERFLYGRIHESLATVIGIKYESPGKAGELKVKSFVSDKYQGLVERAAMF